jgi:hypothetical protein
MVLEIRISITFNFKELEIIGAYQYYFLSILLRVARYNLGNIPYLIFVLLKLLYSIRIMFYIRINFSDKLESLVKNVVDFLDNRIPIEIISTHLNFKFSFNYEGYSKSVIITFLIPIYNLFRNSEHFLRLLPYYIKQIKVN